MGEARTVCQRGTGGVPVVALGSNGRLGRWYGNGAGGVTSQGDFGNGWGSYRDLTAGDYDADGKADLVAIRTSDGHAARWFGDGFGGFTYLSDIGSGWGAYRDLA